MKKLSKVQLAYAAGILDGEGHVGIAIHKCDTCKRGIRHRSNIRMSNTNRQVVRLFQGWFGGSFSIITPREQDRKQQYLWQLNAIDDQIEFLYNILPYLIIKRQQAQIVLEFLDGAHIQSNQWTLTDEEFARRERLAIRIQRLNKRGLLSAS